MSWYRRYRPAAFHQLHLQSVRQTMQQFAARNSFPSVLLFAGPKGTGKTSTARIIAATLNEPTNRSAVIEAFSNAHNAAKTTPTPLQDPNGTDPLIERIVRGTSTAVHELDAASHRGIDDIRSLRERVALPPQEGVVSVYILDEVHMLTTEAFNALLKLLEEPPPQVVFILATTELHKIPETIISRCTLIPFTRASMSEIGEALKAILVQEQLTIDEESLRLIAEQADGSFRDAVKMAEMVVRETGGLARADVERLLTQSIGEAVTQVVSALLDKDASRVMRHFQAMRDRHLQPDFFEKQLCTYLYQELKSAVLATTPESKAQNQPMITEAIALFLLQELLPACGQKEAPIAFLPLELKCVEIINRAHQQKKTGSSAPPSKSKRSSAEVREDEPTATNTTRTTSEPSPSTSSIEAAPEQIYSDNLVPVADGRKLLEKWQEFVAGVSSHNSSIGAILSSAKPVLNSDGRAQIQVFYQFHRDQLQQPRFRKMVEDSVKEVAGEPVAFEFILANGVSSSTVSDAHESSAPAMAIEALL